MSRRLCRTVARVCDWDQKTFYVTPRNTKTRFCPNGRCQIAFNNHKKADLIRKARATAQPKKTLDQVLGFKSITAPAERLTEFLAAAREIMKPTILHGGRHEI